MADRDGTIAGLNDEITRLKALLIAATPTEDKTTAGSAPSDSTKDAANAKKQQTSN